jgi:hypothetical protein
LAASHRWRKHDLSRADGFLTTTTQALRLLAEWMRAQDVQTIVVHLGAPIHCSK